MDSRQAVDYARAHAAAFEQQLFDLIRIPSVSTDPRYALDVRRAAEWLAGNMRDAGIPHVEVIDTDMHPIVYGEWVGAGPDAKTVLVYGHYDVQPALDIEGRPDAGWATQPFEPVVKEDGFVYARGSSDDKGQAFIHVKAVESILKTSGSLPVNIKFLYEGEEESSSASLKKFVRTHQAKLAADVCVISDSGMSAIETPEITYSLRGITYMELHVTGPNRDLHSGQYGGMVHNPALALAQIIAQFHDADNRVRVPGFYDDAVPLDAAERQRMASTAIDEARLLEDVGIAQTWGEAGYTLRERIGARPTLEINGLYSGYIGEGAKTVLPSRAMAKISCRLVANQVPERVYEQIRDYVAQITPPGVRSEVRLLHVGEPALIDPNSPAMRAAVAAYERGWGAAPIFVREGGSIPVVADFTHHLHVPTVLMGYGLNSDGAHGPNERYSLKMFHQGIETAIYFLEEYARG